METLRTIISLHDNRLHLTFNRLDSTLCNRADLTHWNCNAIILFISEDDTITATDIITRD